MSRLLGPCIEDAAQSVTQADVSVVIETVEAAGGQVGINQVRTAEPDGKTIMVHATDLLSAFFVLGGAETDPRDLTPLSRLTNVARSIYVRDDMLPDGADYLDLVELSKTEPVLIGNAAGAAAGQLVDAFLELGGLEAARVDFDGTGPSHAAMLTGELDTSLESTAGALTFAESEPDSIRLLASLGTEDPLAAESGIPTLSELGVENADQIASIIGQSNRGFFGPPNMNADTAAVLTQIFHAVLDNPECTDPLVQTSGETLSETFEPEELSQLIETAVATLQDFSS
jgi:tripartite-type tricarboxylate transporter receptor subunit TctC